MGKQLRFTIILTLLIKFASYEPQYSSGYHQVNLDRGVETKNQITII